MIRLYTDTLVSVATHLRTRLSLWSVGVLQEVSTALLAESTEIGATAPLGFFDPLGFAPVGKRRLTNEDAKVKPKGDSTAV